MINVEKLIEREGLGRYIYEGSDGSVWRVGETPYAIKIAHRDDAWTRRILDNEWEISRALYHCNVSVPEPFGTIKTLSRHTKK